MINPQRVSKPLSHWVRNCLVPFITPATYRADAKLQVTARVLWPTSYNIQSYDHFVSVKKVKPTNTLNLRIVANLYESSALNLHLDPLGSFLFINFSDDIARDSYASTAVIFPDGAYVTWYMRSEEERALATDLSNVRNNPTHCRIDEENRAIELLDSPDCVESLPITIPGSSPVTCLLGGEAVSLTDSNENRSNEMLAVSMAMGAAARMNAIESTLSVYIRNGHSEISSSLSRMNQWKLSKLSESVFESEKAVHRWRYFLTSKHRPGVPDSLWDYEQLDRLFDRISTHFELEERFEDLHNQLTYYSEFLRTVGDYVRHGYSSRLEKIIILIIAIEAGIAVRHLVLDII
jgi:uncharacterized Rmd1/YagE family protein